MFYRGLCRQGAVKPALPIFQCGEHFCLLGWQLLCKLFSPF